MSGPMSTPSWAFRSVWLRWRRKKALKTGWNERMIYSITPRQKGGPGYQLSDSELGVRKTKSRLPWSRLFAFAAHCTQIMSNRFGLIQSYGQRDDMEGWPSLLSCSKVPVSSVLLATENRVDLFDDAGNIDYGMPGKYLR